MGDPTTGEDIFGADESFEGLDLTGKIVLISRGGGVSFYVKANNAVKAGAAATVIYNNDSANNLNMNLTGYEYKNPAVLIPMISAESILGRLREGRDDRPVRRKDGRCQSGSAP